MATSRRHPAASSRRPKTKLGIICPTAFLRQGLSTLIPSSEFAITDLGAGGAESVALAASADPDVVLVDLALSAACVLGEELLEALPGTRPVVVHRTTDLDDLVRLAESGYIGFVAAGSTAEDLVRELRAAMREETNCSPRLATALLRSLRKHSAKKARGDETHLHSLSGRERQVAALLERHLTNKEIAAELKIQFGTVKNHVHNILEKLQLHHRWEVSAPRLAASRRKRR